MNKRNSVENTKELFDSINDNRFTEVKQLLGSVLPLVQAADLPGGGRDVRLRCDNCLSSGYLTPRPGTLVELDIEEPAWSNCADCVLK